MFGQCWLMFTALSAFTLELLFAQPRISSAMDHNLMASMACSPVKFSLACVPRSCRLAQAPGLPGSLEEWIQLRIASECFRYTFTVYCQSCCGVQHLLLHCYSMLVVDFNLTVHRTPPPETKKLCWALHTARFSNNSARLLGVCFRDFGLGI